MNSTKNFFSGEFKKWDGVELNLVKKDKVKKKKKKIFWPHYVGKRKGVQATQGDSSNFECV
jgi:hypothetical protein